MTPKTAFRVANLLSISRLPLAIGYGVLMIMADAKALTAEEHSYKMTWLLLALLCVALVIFTDWADGFVARKYKAASQVGKFIDPIFDVVFFLIAFGVLTWIGLMWHWAFELIVARELVQHLILRPQMLKRGVNVAARMSGKMKTGTQCGILGALTLQPIIYDLLNWNYNREGYASPFFWSRVATAIIAGISVISIIPYIVALVKGPAHDPESQVDDVSPIPNDPSDQTDRPAPEPPRVTHS